MPGARGPLGGLRDYHGGIVLLVVVLICLAPPAAATEVAAPSSGAGPGDLAGADPLETSQSGVDSVVENETALTAEAGVVDSDNTVTVQFTIANHGPDASGYILDVLELPDGYSVADVDANGSFYKPDGHRFVLTDLEGGATRTISMTFSVVGNASDTAEISAQVETTDGVVDRATATVTSAGATLTVSEPSGGAGPGLGATTASLAVVLTMVWLLIVRRLRR